jgi:putative SOS response-associated peptidase YedK
LENNKPTLVLMKWGFPKSGSTEMIEAARSETASQKRMFASPLARRRCVIPTTGFIDWELSENGSKKKIHYIAPDSSMLYMAGIYGHYRNHKFDEPIAGRFVVLTQSGNTDKCKNENRMPVMLYKDEIHRWLTDMSYAKAIMNRPTEANAAPVD